jgi:hypothetical protein
MSTELPHITHESLHAEVVTPGHDPRVETPEYRHAHHQLVVVLDKPCQICGITHSQGGSMETHRSPIERSYMNACDWRKVHNDYPQVVSPETLEQFVDSAANLMVLCHQHHVSYSGIHHTDHPTWVIQKCLLDGNELLVRPGEEQADIQHDEAVDHLIP